MFVAVKYPRGTEVEDWFPFDLGHCAGNAGAGFSKAGLRGLQGTVHRKGPALQTGMDQKVALGNPVQLL